MRRLQALMFIVPFFHLGDAVWSLWTYNHCNCMGTRCDASRTRVPPAHSSDSSLHSPQLHRHSPNARPCAAATHHPSSARRQIRHMATPRRRMPTLSTARAAARSPHHAPRNPRCVRAVCEFDSYTDLHTWVVLQYTFALGRLSALMLCLYLVATGAGTVRTWLLPRNWLMMVLLFGGFMSATALGLPLTMAHLGIDSTASFVASVLM
jgi:hypothetical protein